MSDFEKAEAEFIDILAKELHLYEFLDWLNKKLEKIWR